VAKLFEFFNYLALFCLMRGLGYGIVVYFFWAIDDVEVINGNTAKLWQASQNSPIQVSVLP